MNLEEARNNIGAEVEFDESTKPYTFISEGETINQGCAYIESKFKGVLTIIGIDDDRDIIIKNERGQVGFIHPRHLKLKPQNYKIHVTVDMESREIQRLFFELGYQWQNSGENFVNLRALDYIFTDGFKLKAGLSSHAKDEKQITLQELINMVAEKKQTQPIQESVKPIVDGLETSIAIQDFDSNSDIKAEENIKSHETFQNFEPYEEITWKDALRVVIDGGEVELLNVCGEWYNIKQAIIGDLSSGDFKFRIAPQSITLNGEYTKEDLLKFLKEFE